MNYIDLYLLPVPKAKFEEYVAQAKAFGDVVVEYGALSYQEFKEKERGVGEEGGAFSSLISINEDEILTSAIAVFESKEQHDEVMKKVMADPRIIDMLDKPALADMSRMTYGGFEKFVEGNVTS